MSQFGESAQIGTIQDDVEEFHWLEAHYCYPGGLPVEGTYLATVGDGLQHRGSLNDLGGLCLNYLPAGPVDVEFIPPEDSDTLDTLHKTIKDVLNEILAEKQAETEQTDARLEGMSALEHGGSLLASARRGFWNGAVGLIEFVGDTLVTVANIAVYLSPIERLNNLLEAGYKSYQSGDLTEGKWRQSLLDNMKQEELEDLSRLLGFDPGTIDLTRITEAYEITALIARDDATLAILKNFAKDYVGAQSSLDWAEFAGGGVFEIVLAALLIAFTGGAGLVVQAGSKIRHVSRLRKLGGLFRRLGKALKRKQLNKKIKVGVDKKTRVEADRLEGPKLTSGKPRKKEEDDAAEPSVVPNKKLGKNGLTKEENDYYRNKINNARTPGEANDWRYKRNQTSRKNRGLEPLSRKEWDTKNTRLRANQVRGEEAENGARDALAEHTGKDLKNNNLADDSHTPEQKTSADGKTTTRPDSVGDDIVHEHKHFTGEGDQVVYNSKQIDTQRQGFPDKEHHVTISSDDPDFAAGKPRPSGPLAKKSNVSYYDMDTRKITHAWDSDKGKWVKINE